MFNPALISGMIIVNFALIFYTMAIIVQFKKRRASKTLLVFFSTGVCLDIISTVFMIIGSRRIPVTLHGFIGYAALCAMLYDAVMLWIYRIRNGISSSLSRRIHILSSCAYSFWIIAYFAGLLLVFNKI